MLAIEQVVGRRMQANRWRSEKKVDVVVGMKKDNTHVILFE